MKLMIWPTASVSAMEREREGGGEEWVRSRQAGKGQRIWGGVIGRRETGKKEREEEDKEDGRVWREGGKTGEE